MTDSVGQEIKLGDCIAYRSAYNKTLLIGKVVVLNNKTVRVNKDESNIHWSDLIVLKGFNYEGYQQTGIVHWG